MNGPSGGAAAATGPEPLGRATPRHAQQYAGGRGELLMVLDCSDLARSAQFWTAVLGYVRADDSDGTYQALVPADGAGVELLLQRVPESKAGKNRLHLDLRTRELDAEVARVCGLGASRLTTRPSAEDGWTWHILGDPDGNEFCVVQPDPGYWPRS